MTKPIELFYCSSRRSTALYPHGSPKPAIGVSIHELASGVVKSDYAINTGNESLNDFARAAKLCQRGRRSV